MDEHELAVIHIRAKLAGQDSGIQHGRQRAGESSWICSGGGVLRASIPAAGEELGAWIPAGSRMVKAKR